MSDEILIKEQWVKSGISEHWVRIEDYVALEEKLRGYETDAPRVKMLEETIDIQREKLRECEQERVKAACDRNKAEFRLAIANEALEEVYSSSAKVSAWGIRETVTEALKKLRTGNEVEK